MKRLEIEIYSVDEKLPVELKELMFLCEERTYDGGGWHLGYYSGDGEFAQEGEWDRPRYYNNVKFWAYAPHFGEEDL